MTLTAKAIWAAMFSLLLTFSTASVQAKSSASEKQDKVKKNKNCTGSSMKDGKSQAKPKGKAYGVYGTQPSSKGDEKSSTSQGKAKSEKKDKAKGQMKY